MWGEERFISCQKIWQQAFQPTSHDATFLPTHPLRESRTAPPTVAKVSLMWNRLTGFSPWVSGPPLFRAARSHPVPQVETRLGVRGRAKRSGRHGRCAGREVAKMCATRRPEIGTPGHSTLGSRHRLWAKVWSPHLPAHPAALSLAPSFPAGLCQVDLRGLLSTELVFGVSVHTAGPADPEKEDAQWATHGGDPEPRAEAGWEACLPRSVGL